MNHDIVTKQHKYDEEDCSLQDIGAHGRDTSPSIGYVDWSKVA